MEINEAASAMGKKGGSVSGGKKAESSRKNAQKARESKKVKREQQSEVKV